MSKITITYKNYKGLPETTALALSQSQFAHFRAVIENIIAFGLGVAVASLIEDTLLEEWVMYVVCIVSVILIAFILHRIDAIISARPRLKAIIRQMFDEVNLSKQLKQQATESFLSKQSPVYLDDNYAYIIARSISEYDWKRKSLTITDNVYKEIATDIINSIGKTPSPYVLTSFTD